MDINECEEKILDEKQWHVEAQAVIDDVKHHVQEMSICDNEKLPSTNCSIYFNLTTLEDLKFCVKLSPSGFNVVSNQHNTVTNEDSDCFETIYSLLSSISPEYQNSFSNNLMIKLMELSKQQNYN